MARDRINLSVKGKLVKAELEIAKVLNKFFSNIAKILKFQNIPNTNLSYAILKIKL